MTLLFALACSRSAEVVVPPLPPGPPGPPLPRQKVVFVGVDGASCETTDARNIARVDAPTVGVAVCDVGAFEFVPPPSTPSP